VRVQRIGEKASEREVSDRWRGLEIYGPRYVTMGSVSNEYSISGVSDSVVDFYVTVVVLCGQHSCVRLMMPRP
jgi:hypothetical protein